MSHDRHGRPLKAGDTVHLPCRVVAISEGETGCNVHLQALDPLGTGEYRPDISCNSRLVELAPASPAAAAT